MLPNDRLSRRPLSLQIKHAMSPIDPGCVKTLRGIIAPGILRSVVMWTAKKRKNLSSDRHYDQIRFRFRTTKTHLGHGGQVCCDAPHNSFDDVVGYHPRLEGSHEATQIYHSSRRRSRMAVRCDGAASGADLSSRLLAIGVRGMRLLRWLFSTNCDAMVSLKGKTSRSSIAYQHLDLNSRICSRASRGPG